MTQYTVSVKKSVDEPDWSELSTHDDRDSALSALRGALISENVPWTTAKLDPGNELFVLRPDRAVVEVMDD